MIIMRVELGFTGEKLYSPMTETVPASLTFGPPTIRLLIEIKSNECWCKI